MQTDSVRSGKKAPAYPISSVDNALRLLQLFRERESVRLTEACEFLDVAHSTAHRLLAMLVHHGFVRQDTRTRAYRPGPTLIEIGLAVVQKMDVRSQARPVLERLAGMFDETVHLVTLEGTQARFVDAVEGTRALRVAPRLGALLPAHCTSAGKALLAELPDQDLRELYADPDALAQQTDRSLATLAQLVAALDEVRSTGYATNYEESEEGVGSVSVALRDGTGAPVAAVAVAVPTYRLNQNVRREVAAALLDLAAQFRGAH
ncbi:MAG TPA: IclR family transcriptional regulator [Mycobacteriales bacterium]|nr:IclR family transcriptional regulator [Mycobacteriales bacterium]